MKKEIFSNVFVIVLTAIKQEGLRLLVYCSIDI